MRKTLLVITVLLVATQAYAGTVTMSVDDEGGGWAAIRYSADANVSGFGLKVTADSGASFTDINDYNVGECTASVQGYGIFPGTIDVNELTGVVDYNGTPVAPNDDPGASGTGFGTGTLVLEMGALYVEGNEPALSGTLILVKVDGDCNVCVETEPVRGNVVLTDANEASVIYSPNCVSVSAGCGTCPLDISSWDAGVPDGWVGPEDLFYVLGLINGCASQYCDVAGLTDAEKCLDVSSWDAGVPDGWVGPEDLFYLLGLINGCASQYCACP